MFLPAILNVWYTQEALSVGNPMFRTHGYRFLFIVFSRYPYQADRSVGIVF